MKGGKTGLGVGMKVLVQWHCSFSAMAIGDEGEIHVIDHHSSEMTHNGGGMYVQVPQHLITAPPTDKLNFVTVDVGAEESHGVGNSQ